MILFLAGIAIGSLAGMILMALIIASKKEDNIRSKITE